MKIQVEFLGLPALSGIIGKKTSVDLSGVTMTDLFVHLVRQFGPEVRQSLLASDGKLDPTIQAMVNDEGFVPRDLLAQKTLQEGDTVKFLLLAGGG